MKLPSPYVSFRLQAVMVVLAVLFCIVTLPAAAGAQIPTKIKGVYRMLVGDFEVITLSDGINQRTMEQQLQLLQGDREKNKEVLTRAYPGGHVDNTVNAFLIDTGAKLVLIDAGNGRAGRPIMGKVADNLRTAGYQPEQVTEVYLTHMHGDHVGGLVDNGELVFPNATVYANKREADYWLDKNNLDAAPDSAKRTFQAVQTAVVPYIDAGRFQTFSGNTQMSPGIRAEELLGHTPGHTAYVVESRGQTLMLWGDIIHVAAVQFANPAITLSFDSDKAAAANSRQQILPVAAKQQWLVGGTHLAFPGLGHVRADDSVYVFTPLAISAAE